MDVCVPSKVFTFLTYHLLPLQFGCCYLWLVTSHVPLPRKAFLYSSKVPSSLENIFILSKSGLCVQLSFFLLQKFIFKKLFIYLF